MTRFKRFQKLGATVVGVAAFGLATSAQADMILDVGGGGPAGVNDFTFTVDVDTNTSTGAPPKGFINVSGGLGAATGTFDVRVQAVDSYTLDPSNNITVNTRSDLLQNNGSGWGIAGGGPIDEGELLLFTFDFSNLNLPAGLTVGITGFNTGDQSSGQTARYLVDGESDTVLVANTGTNDFDVTPPTVLSTGSSVGWSLPAGGDNFRLDELTLDLVIPEPTSLALLGLGGLALLRRRG